MVLRVGDVAPAWAGTTAAGQALSFESFRGRPLVLYFYPKAGSTGCRVEAKEFARHYAEFENAGVPIVGVSVDSVESQKRFSDDCQLPFPLVADRDQTIARSYGVLGILGIAKRVTFWIGPGGVVEEVVAGLLPGPHVRTMVDRLGGSERSSGVATGDKAND